MILLKNKILTTIDCTNYISKYISIPENFIETITKLL